MTQRYCRTCSGWHDLNEPWPHQTSQTGQSIQVIKDIDPYKAVAVDRATGKAPIIKSRSEHREFLKRNGYYEVGNEHIKNHENPISTVSGADIRRTIDQLRQRR